ncbi:MAG: PhzF family phenazine biosynthesis protein [Actinomycetota bacterium]
MRIPFVLADVFSQRPFSGNQLCVVPDSAGLNAVTMQTLAAEIGFAESAFVTSADGDRYAMRIFTPTAEIPFAGHPTLGTAYALASAGRITSPAIQEVAAGEFHVTVDLPGRSAAVRQLPPVFGVEATDLRSVAEAVGISHRDLHPDRPPQVVGTGLTYLLVPVTTPTAVAQAARDDRTLPRLLNAAGAHGAYLFSVTGDDGVKARMFPADAHFGSGEDAATGSAAGPLGAYLAARGLAGMPGSVAISQGEEIRRPSTLLVTAGQADDGAWSIIVGGGVFIVGDGAFEL